MLDTVCMNEIELRDYQKDVLNKIHARFNSGEKEVVLAAAPSSGKTVIAMQFMKEVSGKILVLTHGTALLRNQWKDRFKKFGLKTSSRKKDNARITYQLPQSTRNWKKFPKVDYIIIDEAHQFTHAKMVQKCIEECKPKHILYLTGTPSKFIKEGKKPIIVDGLSLIEKGFVSDLYVGMVSTNAKVNKKDYNQSGDLQANRYKRLVKTVDEDLDNLLEAIVNRLKLPSIVKNNPQISKIASIAFKKLHKTMISCHSVAQAKKVHQWMQKNGITSTISTHKEDLKSEEIDKFVNDKDITVLIVVYRGILGFDMTDLVNVVDLTLSHNIDRIYQLYARVMRKSDQYKKKYFFKFADEVNMQFHKFHMNAALCMLHEDFISKYNGKNLNAMEVPVQLRTKTKKKSECGTGKKKGSKLRVQVIDKLFFDTVSTTKILRDIWNKIGQKHNEYAFVRFSDIKRDVFGEWICDPEGAKHAIKNLCLKLGRRLNKNDDVFLYRKMKHYIAKSSSAYDSLFKEWMDINFPLFEYDFNDIVNFCKKYNKIPNNRGKLPNEKRYYGHLFRNKEKYKNEIKKLNLDIEKNKINLKIEEAKSYIEFCKTNLSGFHAKQIGSKEEKKWNNWFRNLKKNSERYKNVLSFIENSNLKNGKINSIMYLKNNKTTKKVKCTKTGKIYSSLTTAAKTLGYKSRTSINHKIKKGEFEYVD